MKVAVTGGAGFIGSHVVDKLVEAGNEVVVIDAQAPHRADVGHADVDILDLPGLVRATKGCDAVFHLAAVANVNDAFDKPVEAIEVNITGTAKVWEAARRNEVKRAVLASTVWVYAGAVDDAPLDEDAAFHLPSAGHVYTSSKMAAELVVHNYHELYGQEFTILRYGIPFGPRMRDALVIPRFVKMALDGTTITLHGDGSQYRNYVYVEDLAEAHVTALGAEGANEVFNLEGDRAISLRYMIDCIRDSLGRPVAVEFLPARPGDYAGKEVSNDKAAKLLGWTPHTSFEEGLRRYIDWYVESTSGIAAAAAAADEA